MEYTFTTTITNPIEAYIMQQNLSRRTFAKLVGMHQQNINLYIWGTHQRMTDKAARKFAAVMGIPPETLQRDYAEWKEGA